MTELGILFLSGCGIGILALTIYFIWEYKRSHKK